ncbi:hypothetical protein D3C74_418580 [compost metagenome]
MLPLAGMVTAGCDVVQMMPSRSTVSWTVASMLVYWFGLVIVMTPSSIHPESSYPVFSTLIT